MFTIKIGFMPGRVDTYTFEEPVSVAEALETAGLDASGYDIKIDGVKVEMTDNVPATAGVLALVKRVKGNAVLTLKIGFMPGRVDEYTFESPVTVAAALETAGLDAAGYDIKLDGVKVDINSTITDGNVLALVKRVKGN